MCVLWIYFPAHVCLCANQPSAWTSVCGGGADARWAEGRRPAAGRTAWTPTGLCPLTRGREDTPRPARTLGTGRPGTRPRCRLRTVGEKRQGGALSGEFKPSFALPLTGFEMKGWRAVRNLHASTLHSVIMSINHSKIINDDKLLFSCSLGDVVYTLASVLFPRITSSTSLLYFLFVSLLLSVVYHFSVGTFLSGLTLAASAPSSH